VVLRARRIQSKPGDTVVKLRPVVPDQLPARIRKSPGFGVEVDVVPGGFVCSGSASSRPRRARRSSTSPARSRRRERRTRDRHDRWDRHVWTFLDQADLERLEARLIVELSAPLPPEEVQRCLDACVTKYQTATVHKYLTVLIEREARDRLGASTGCTK
jgi:hypothetical protein